MRRIIAVVLGTVALVAGLAGSASAGPSVPPMPPCQYEDSANCVFAAHLVNDGQGRSFVAGPPRDPAPRVRFISHRDAERSITLWAIRHCRNGHCR